MRRPRSIEELSKDPTTLFHAQRLIGAVAMTAHWMQLQDDPMTKAMGERLDEQVGFFFTNDKGDGWSKHPTYPPRTKEPKTST